MAEADFFTEVENALLALRKGAVILCPIDTGWALACNATVEEALEKMSPTGQQDNIKKPVILVADETAVLQYVSAPDLSLFDFLQEQKLPTTVLFDGVINLPDSLTRSDGSVAIRLVQEAFCRHLIKRLRKPLAVLPAAREGASQPVFFGEIPDVVKQQAHYVVQWQQQERTALLPAQVIRWKNGAAQYIK